MHRDPYVNVAYFDSVTELAAFANEHANDRRREADPKFYGATTFAQAVARCAMGHDQCVPRATELLGKLENSVAVSTTAFESSVAGVIPSVPEYLAGDPESMFDQVSHQSDAAPLTIYVDMASSASISADAFMKRGIAILALTMMLSQVRPVNLNLFSCGGCCATHRTPAMVEAKEDYSIVVARIETAPLDLARAAFAMTDVAVPRRLFYAAQQELCGFDGLWPTLRGAERGATTSPEYIGRLKSILQTDGETLLIPAISALDPDCKMMLDEPVEWLNGKLIEYAGMAPA